MWLDNDAQRSLTQICLLIVLRCCMSGNPQSTTRFTLSAPFKLMEKHSSAKLQKLKKAQYLGQIFGSHKERVAKPSL